MSTPTQKHAVCTADPCGVLDQQDIIDLVGVQIAKSAQGDPLATCKTLASWSSVHRLPCSQHVFENACKHLGFWGAKARDKAIYWLTNHPEPSALAREDYVAGAELDWKLVFAKLCRCAKKGVHPNCGDPAPEFAYNFGLLSRWANVLEARSPDAAGDAAGNATAHEMVLEMCDHAVYGHMSGWDKEFARVARRWYELLALSLIDPADHEYSRARQVSPLSKSLAMGTRVKNALFPTSSNDPSDTLNIAFESGFFTPNMRLHGVDWSHTILPPFITVDLAAFLWPHGMCRDTKLEGGAVPNVILDAVLSHPKYDPRKCLNRPRDRHLGFVPLEERTFGDGGITLAGIYLARFHERGVQEWELCPSPFVASTTKSGKDATLRRILEHPLQNLRQRSNARSLVHACLWKTITCLDPREEDDSLIIFRIADGLRAWIWRLEALRILWEKTCDEERDDNCIWRWLDCELRTPRQLFEHKWDIYYNEVLELLEPYFLVDVRARWAGPTRSTKINKATALAILKHIDDTAYSPLNELFVVAERG